MSNWFKYFPLNIRGIFLNICIIINNFSFEIFEEIVIFVTEISNNNNKLFEIAKLPKLNISDFYYDLFYHF